MPRRQEADYALWLLGHKNIVSLSFVGLVFVGVGGGGDAPTCLMDCYSILHSTGRHVQKDSMIV